MSCDLDFYSLPTISFVGGETQELKFHIYRYNSSTAYDLSDCTMEFAIVDHANKRGTVVLTKSGTAEYDDSTEIYNICSVTLSASDTVDLDGKYIYQISILDGDGATQIPSQGFLYINTNIDKDFI